MRLCKKMLEHIYKMSREDKTTLTNFPRQYLKKEYLTRASLAAVVIIIITLMVQGLTRFKGGRLFEGIISISIRSTIIEWVTIFIPHVIFLILLYVLFRQFFSNSKLKKIGSKRKFIIFSITVSFILFIYAFQFVVPQSSEGQFVFFQQEWRVEKTSTPRSIVLAGQSISITQGTNFFFTVQRPAILVNDRIFIPPYNGSEKGIFRVHSLEIQVTDDELAEAFGLKTDDLLLGFLLNPNDWNDIFIQLKNINPETSATFNDTFPESPRDDFLGGNITNVVTFSIFENNSARNITVSYDVKSGVLVHALITEPQSVLELILVSSDDVRGFKQPSKVTQPKTTNSTSSTTNLNVSISNTLVTSLPISNQQLTNLIILTFLLAIPLVITSLAGLYYLRKRKERNVQDSNENVTITLNNLNEINDLPLKEQIIQRYRLATKILEEMGAPKKDSLTPTEFEVAVSRLFGEPVKNDFLTLSKAFKLAKFEEERRLSPMQLQRLAAESKTVFERINEVYNGWLQEIEELELREEWEQ